MTKTADQVVVAANGSIYVGDVGATAPTDINDPIDPAEWIELGYTNEDGVTLTDSKEITDINAWQSFYAIRKIMTAKSGQVAFNLLQWNGATVRLAFGGGTVTEDSPGAYRYTPPLPGPIDERSLIVAWVDGNKNYRLICTKGLVSEDVESELTKSAAGELPIVFGFIGEEGVNTWELVTDDPAFEPIGSS